MNQRGFTLVEIIIALTILSMLFIVISYIQARGAASYAATSHVECVVLMSRVEK
jgi:prepilin-type N-terminal cleavage/methylation domain-containing protein